MMASEPIPWFIDHCIFEKQECANDYWMPITKQFHRFSDVRFTKWVNMLRRITTNLHRDDRTKEKLLEFISTKPNRLFWAGAWDIYALLEGLCPEEI